jgi:hypothetical protein
MMRMVEEIEAVTLEAALSPEIVILVIAVLEILQTRVVHQCVLRLQ